VSYILSIIIILQIQKNTRVLSVSGLIYYKDWGKAKSVVNKMGFYGIR